MIQGSTNFSFSFLVEAISFRPSFDELRHIGNKKKKKNRIVDTLDLAYIYSMA